MTTELVTSDGGAPAPRRPAARTAVSVVVPTPNRAHVVGRAIASVLAQTFGDFEILVVDDGSDDETASGQVEARDLKDLGVRLGVPLKFVPRAVASVTRLGIITATLDGDRPRLRIHRDKLARRKFAMDRSRRRLSKCVRESIKEASGNRCACCGKPLDSSGWVLDHIIPLSLLGADAEANLVPMLKSCNADKWDRLLRGGLKYSRGERVAGNLGVRFIDGVFWPVINGRIRRELRPRKRPLNAQDGSSEYEPSGEDLRRRAP